ncbi:Uncharacterized protein TCM_006607 [Theobroma cacao]|uniref:RNase H type-1 domain-containing protein n=1 Tax=Theobroma cacao TaxID=3641 RepID=A0A061DZ14_THECC|nr:Uncharacterized protein TCM_006607 [Theobroma cacao]
MGSCLGPAGKELMVIWNNIKPTPNCDKIWNTAIFAITWTVWICRNNVIFHNKAWDKELIWELIKLRVAMWVKAKWNNSAYSITDMFRCPAVGFNQQREENTRPLTTWERLGVGTVKFNVDGAANGCPGEVGIGGLLRNENG